MTAEEVIKDLLRVLPDSSHDKGDDAWTAAWNELTDDDQDEVVKARSAALSWLKENKQT